MITLPATSVGVCFREDFAQNEIFGAWPEGFRVESLAEKVPNAALLFATPVELPPVRLLSRFWDMEGTNYSAPSIKLSRPTLERGRSVDGFEIHFNYVNEARKIFSRCPVELTTSPDKFWTSRRPAPIAPPPITGLEPSLRLQRYVKIHPIAGLFLMLGIFGLGVFFCADRLALIHRGDHGWPKSSLVQGGMAVAAGLVVALLNWAVFNKISKPDASSKFLRPEIYFGIVSVLALFFPVIWVLPNRSSPGYSYSDRWQVIGNIYGLALCVAVAMLACSSYIKRQRKARTASETGNVVGLPGTVASTDDSSSNQF